VVTGAAREPSLPALEASRPGAWRHAGPLAFFALLALAWTWPLARHFSTAIAGDPGDNFSLVWNLWWMRHVRSTAGLEFFRTTFLFHPFGASLANHPHTALPGLVAATALSPLPVAAAQNAILLANVFANMATMYALAWTLTHHRRAAILAAVVFGTSPYFSGHLLGHFDLLSGWVMPAFALSLHIAIQRRSKSAAIAAGFVLAAAAYTAYYYIVYLALFGATYVLASAGWIRVSWSPREQAAGLRRTRASLVALALAALGLALWIAVTGGTVLQAGGVLVSLRRPQNPLSAMWLAWIGVAMCTWRLTVRFDRAASGVRRAVVAAAWIGAVFALACLPLIAEAARLVWQGEYVTPTYFWRSAPRGVDLSAPFIGHPRHPLLRSLTQRAYEAMQIDYIETVGWIGILPGLLLLRRWRAAAQPEARVWGIVAGVFALWAAGPFLTVGGFDTGLWLPQSLARYLPFVANARVPGRAMIGAYMAIAILMAITVTAARGRLRSPVMQWLLVFAVIAEYFDAPIPLTPLDDPAPYRALAAEPPGGVCEVPFGIGDGLGPGAGSQERRVLFYATIHEHPLVGGYIGRMPADAERRYRAMPVTSTLLRLSRRADEHEKGDQAAEPPGDAIEGPCRYFVVNRPAASADLDAYVRNLPVERLAGDATRDIYRLRITRPMNMP
jgi:hypothetical protein